MSAVEAGDVFIIGASTTMNWVWTQSNPQRLVASVVLVPLLAYSFAPFHGMDLSFVLRLVFWAGVLVLAVSITWLAGKVVRERMRHRSVFLRDAAFALAILILFAPSLWLLACLVFACGGQSPPGIVSAMPYGVMFASGILLVRQQAEDVTQETLPQPRLVSRLPDSFDGEIYHLSVRDHLVHVATSQGRFTIRSRFTDAIAEMEPIAGHCTHRSHWVTEAAISGVEKQAGRTFLRMCNGDLIPVSRKYHPALEQAGLI